MCIGKIVEIEGTDGLFLVVDFKNYEDYSSCSYDREYYLYKYDIETPDDIHVKLQSCYKVKVTGLKNKVKTREDKKPYEMYGYSKIRGEKTVMLERIWEEVKLPTR